MAKRRALLTTGNSVTQIKRGPERDRSEIDLLRDDLDRLEVAYSPHKGTLINEGQPLYSGETDEIFDEDII